MRTISIIGIGAGSPDHLTIQAIAAMRSVDVFLTIDKGEGAEDLLRWRRELLERHVGEATARIVAIPDPPRERTPDDYRSTVDAWHEQRSVLIEAALADELDGDGRAGILVWGDPSLYDSTIRIVERIRARGDLELAVEVIPGVTSVQALTAAHGTPLHDVGEPVLFTTGRRLIADVAAAPQQARHVVVMLDAGCTFRTLVGQGFEIFWGAYLGTPHEMLVAGALDDVAATIEHQRTEARRRIGWIMDVYLLRRRPLTGER